MEIPNKVEEPLLSGLTNASKSDKHYQKDVPKRKGRLRRSRSAPLIISMPGDLYADEAIPSPPRRLHPSFKRIAAFLTIYLGVGAICFYIVGDQLGGEKTGGVVDALYFSIVTMTTVGYGDLVPRTVVAKLLACAFVFTGMALVGLVLSKGADYLVEKQEALLVKALQMRKRFRPTEVMNDIETKKVRYKCIVVFIILVVLIVTGTIFLALVEKLEFVDAFYCVCVTVTSLGYGDRHFSTKGGRIFAIVWILTSTLCLAQFFLYVAELNTERRQNALVKWVLTRRVTIVDLEAADIDNDGLVDGAEFVLYKLKEMGKITQEDVSLVMKQFVELDIDQSGTLSVYDLKHAQ